MQNFNKKSLCGIAYLEKEGPVENTVFLLHGNSCDPKEYIEAMASEELSNLRVIAPWFPGHGPSERYDDEKGYTFERFVEVMDNFIKELAPEGYSVYGHSFGGYVAIEIAKHNPPRSLIVSGMSPISKLAEFKISREEMEGPEVFMGATLSEDVFDSFSSKIGAPKYAKEQFYNENLVDPKFRIQMAASLLDYEQNHGFDQINFLRNAQFTKVTFISTHDPLQFPEFLKECGCFDRSVNFDESKHWPHIDQNDLWKDSLIDSI